MSSRPIKNRVRIYRFVAGLKSLANGKSRPITELFSSIPLRPHTSLLEIVDSSKTTIYSAIHIEARAHIANL